MTTEFKLSDFVISKHTGLPASGIVIAIMTAECYRHTIAQGRPVDSFNRWNDTYPDWPDKPIIIVLLREPQKPLSYDEWKEGLSQENKYEMNNNEMQVLYKYTVQKAQTIAFPIDDLEVVE